ncbi:IclR family transcriptional regulator [Paradesulfitobacterium aromaticivorans]
MTENAENKEMVRAVERALNILEELAKNQGYPKRITELATSLGLGKTTVHRLLRTLVSKGYVNKAEDSDKYCLGLKMMELGGVVARNLEPRSQAAQIIKQLAADTGQTVHLAVQANGEVVYIEKVESKGSIKMASFVGQRSYLHSTGLGKAICAFLPLEEVEVYLKEKGMPRRTSRTIVSWQEFKDHMAQIRAQGYAIDEMENEESIRCVAAPVFDHDGRVIAAISVAGTVLQVTHDRVESLARQVVSAAAEVSERMGYRAGTHRIGY